MYGLKSTAPQVWYYFEKGGFVVQKSDIPFTASQVLIMPANKLTKYSR